MNRRVLSWVVSLLIAAIVIGSLGPFAFRHRFTAIWNRPEVISGWALATPHQLLHFAAFGLLSYLTTLRVERTNIRILSVVAICSLGVLIESLQSLLSAAPLEVADVRDDTLAAAAGFLLGTACTILLRQASGA